MTDPEREAELKEALDPNTAPARLVELLAQKHTCEAVLQNPTLPLVLVEWPDFWAAVPGSSLSRVAASPRCPASLATWALTQKSARLDGDLLVRNPALPAALPAALASGAPPLGGPSPGAGGVHAAGGAGAAGAQRRGRRASRPEAHGQRPRVARPARCARTAPGAVAPALPDRRDRAAAGAGARAVPRGAGLQPAPRARAAGRLPGLARRERPLGSCGRSRR